MTRTNFDDMKRCVAPKVVNKGTDMRDQVIATTVVILSCPPIDHWNDSIHYNMVLLPKNRNGIIKRNNIFRLANATENHPVHSPTQSSPHNNIYPINTFSYTSTFTRLQSIPHLDITHFPFTLIYI